MFVVNLISNILSFFWHQNGLLILKDGLYHEFNKKYIVFLKKIRLKVESFYRIHQIKVSLNKSFKNYTSNLQKDLNMLIIRLSNYLFLNILIYKIPYFTKTSIK